MILHIYIIQGNECTEDKQVRNTGFVCFPTIQYQSKNCVPKDLLFCFARLCFK